jgi:hypothetical protein
MKAARAAFFSADGPQADKRKGCRESTIFLYFQPKIGIVALWTFLERIYTNLTKSRRRREKDEKK